MRVKDTKKQKKGFTLIELLVTITLMLGILGVAIVSFINVSDKKKEESYEKVKEQTVLAAEQFFETYKYYLEGLREVGAYARVSVGMLVREDFLNKVSDPRTGKALNDCDYVEVKLDKENSNYSYEYVQNNAGDECNVQSYVKVKETGAPEIDVKIIKGTQKNGYYITDTVINADVKTGGNGDIDSVKYCTSNGTCSNEMIYEDVPVKNNNTYVYETTNGSLKESKDGVDGRNVSTYFKATNVAGKTVIGSIKYAKDTTNPDCGKTEGTSNTWTNTDRTVKQYCSDITSGCTKEFFSQTFNKTTQNSKIQIEDKAGNTNACNVNVYVDKTKPACGSNDGSTNWTNQNRTVTQTCKDSDSGCDSVSKTFTNNTKASNIEIKDKAGNTNVCSVNVYVDKIKPSCNISISGKVGNKVGGLQWYIPNDNVSLSMSKSKTSGWSSVNSYGLSTSRYNTSKTTTGTQGETANSTWYGYVKDEAGNENECSTNFGVETSASMTFDPKTTNGVVSYNPGKLSNGKTVFGRIDLGTCGYGNCSAINCTTDGSNQCPKEYFARSCMYVSNYYRYFYVNSISTLPEERSIKAQGEAPTLGAKKIINQERYGCITKNKYNAFGCGDETGNLTNVTAHKYQYTTPAGRKTNEIRLYAEYSIGCGY